MKRRPDESDDSRELLLDTICNMFGTIIFVSLIAALLALTSTRGKTETSLASIDVEREQQLGALVARAEELERDLATLPAAAGLEDDPEAVERVESALGEIARREELVRRYSDAVASVTGNLSDIGAQVEPLREEIDRLQSALDSARNADSSVAVSFAPSMPPRSGSDIATRRTCSSPMIITARLTRVISGWLPR